MMQDIIILFDELGRSTRYVKRKKQDARHGLYYASICVNKKCLWSYHGQTFPGGAHVRLETGLPWERQLGELGVRVGKRLNFHCLPLCAI